MQVLQEAFGVEGERVWTAAAAFGGGLGRRQYVCGAVTGAAMALGLQTGVAAEDPTKIGNAVRPRVQAFLDAFKAKFGSVECGELLHPYDFTTPGGYEAFRASGLKKERCHQYVKFAVENMLS